MRTHCQHTAEICPTCKKPCLLDAKFHDNLMSPKNGLLVFSIGADEELDLAVYNLDKIQRP